MPGPPGATPAMLRPRWYVPGPAMKKIAAVPRTSAGHPPPASPALKLFVILSRAYNAVNRHAHAHVESHGFTLAEWGILEVLYHKGPLLLGDVQRRILVSSGGITYLVDRLESRGLLERRACENDRRARYAALTPEGEKLVARLFPDHLDAIERAMAGLNGPQQRECAALLKALGTAAAAPAGAQAAGRR
jgi:MarR family transcriptional regulator, 2-MHQ and catechol-resistance regulon repressor